MPSTEQNAAANLPQSITLGGISYVIKDTPELMDLVKDAANRERSKLYSAIEETKRGFQTLKNVEIVPDAQPVQQQAPLNMEELAAVVDKVVTARMTPLLEAQQSSKQAELEAYRRSVIAANAGRCIPDYVKGNTKEEIDAALAESIRVRAQFPSANTTHQTGGHVVDPLIAEQMRVANENGGVTPGYTPPEANGQPSQGVRQGIPEGAMTPQPAQYSNLSPVAAAAAANAANTQSSPVSNPALPNRAVTELAGMPDTSKMTASEYARRRTELMEQFASAVNNNI